MRHKKGAARAHIHNSLSPAHSQTLPTSSSPTTTPMPASTPALLLIACLALANTPSRASARKLLDAPDAAPWVRDWGWGRGWRFDGPFRRLQSVGGPDGGDDASSTARKLLGADDAAPWGWDWGVGRGRDWGRDGGFRRLQGVVTDAAGGPVGTASAVASAVGAPFNAGAVQGALAVADGFAAPFVG